MGKLNKKYQNSAFSVRKKYLIPEKFATKYWSANVFGNVAIIEGAIHKIYVLRLEIREATGKARKK